MGKYDRLGEFLRGRADDEVALSFDEIEAILGFPLPDKAQHHRAWWSNNPSNSRLTKAWLEAGYRSERVDMTSRRLVFARRPASGAAPRRFSLDRLRAALGGTVTVAPGVDLTAPTGERWDAEG